MHREEHETAVAAFIRNNGITRCPTACAPPTQATPDPTDRVRAAALCGAAQPHPQAAGHGAGPVVLDRYDPDETR